MVAEKTGGDESVVGEIGEDVAEVGCQRKLLERERPVWVDRMESPLGRMATMLSRVGWMLSQLEEQRRKLPVVPLSRMAEVDLGRHVIELAKDLLLEIKLSLLGVAHCLPEGLPRVLPFEVWARVAVT